MNVVNPHVSSDFSIFVEKNLVLLSRSYTYKTRLGWDEPETLLVTSDLHGRFLALVYPIQSEACLQKPLE